MNNAIKALVIVLAVGTSINYLIPADPKAGETWEDCVTQPNPFIEKSCRKYKVLEIKGDYIHFTDLQDNTNYTSTIWHFKHRKSNEQTR